MMTQRTFYLGFGLLVALLLAVAGLVNAAGRPTGRQAHFAANQNQPQASAGSATIGGGVGNRAGEQATVGGGYHNQATGFRATISGGSNNLANNGSSVISGGEWNKAIYSFATIGGGLVNTASALNATISGGSGNVASGSHSTVGGGTSNTASNVQTTVGGGVRNTASAAYATVSGGLENTATGRRSTVGGGAGNMAGGEDTTISGGLSNQATDRYSTVGGGRANQAGNLNDNVEDARYATVGGGQDNRALNLGATVGGGVDNCASGVWATVPGGLANQAGGDYSFAAGRRAQIRLDHPGAILLADSNDVDFNSVAANELAVRATGGVRLVTAINATGAPEAGVRLAAGSGSWQSLSSRAAKAGVEQVDRQEILARLLTIPISTWHYNTQEPAIHHIGPMAEDFYQVFGLGDSDEYLNDLDLNGVALVAIQGLAQLSTAQAAQITAQQEQIDRLVKENMTQQTRLTELEARLTALEKRGQANSSPLP